jgi:hypothetical protein
MEPSIRSGSRLWLDRHRNGARVGDGQPRSDVRVGGDNYFITGADAIRPQDQVQGFQPVADPDAMLHATIGGKFLLERFDFLAQDIPAGLHDAQVGSIQLGL